jgi:diguanylate cyclase (GGDEF)-like protein
VWSWHRWQQEIDMRILDRAFGTLRQFGPCVLATVIGIAMTLTAIVVIVKRDNQDADHQFRVLAENHFMVLQTGLNEYVNHLKAVVALFDSSTGPVTRSEFSAFARPLLRENSAIATLSWVPRITDAERATHEREGILQGLANYHIKDIRADGTMTNSPQRSEYYPIFYATLPLTSPLYGLDLRSEPPTLTEMDLARDEDRLGLSPVPKLVSSDNTESGFLFSLPVYRQGSDHDTVASRRRNLIGFVHGSIVTGRMVDTIIMENKTPKGLDVFFYTPESGRQAMPLYVHPSRLRNLPLAPMSLGSAIAGSSWSRELTADGQPSLTMVVRPMPGGPLEVHHGRAWIVLALGLITTAVVVIYIRTIRRHTFRIMRVNQRIADLAKTDALTSLVNRSAFIERLNTAFAACRRGGKPFAVLYIDLDHFKDVNDTLGHAVGDALLQEVAARLLGMSRANDVVARFGGDEFAILQSDAADLTAAGALASKIGNLLAEPYSIAGNEVHISASIGISHYTPDAVGPDAMIIQSDLALYRAKEDGRGCFRFHSVDLDREVQERVVIADELRGAIDRNEFELHYQPQVELRSGRIIGVEALLRWNHPKLGRVPPLVFIPVAERTGQIQALGHWVLDEACRQLRNWQRAGIAPELVGVNFSALHFKSSIELDREVAAILDRWGIEPDLIEIELTETELMEITQLHHERFERLRRLGVRIAIDDFGTGYSSLSYLAHYPISRVKIAQELVSRVDSDSRNAAVVRAAVRLAHELDIEVIAEGIETEGQKKFLLSAGCEHGQGYLFSKPVTAEEATALLRAGKIKPAQNPLRLVEISAA